MELDVWLKKYRIFSRSMMLIAMGQIVWITWWGTKFAETTKLSGGEIAGVLAAVQIPATLLFTSVYKTYNESKTP